MSFQQPQQATQGALFEIAAAFIGALRSSRKDVVDRHHDRSGPAGTVPVDRSQLGIIKDECPSQLLRRAELPIVHAQIPKTTSQSARNSSNRPRHMTNIFRTTIHGSGDLRLDESGMKFLAIIWGDGLLKNLLFTLA